MIKRAIEEKILNHLNKGKAILIFGSRQVGKTTLLKQLASKINDEILWINGDDYDIREIWHKISSLQLKAFIGKKNMYLLMKLNA